MGKEIERKFLTSSEGWKENITRTIAIRQGYLNSDPGRTIRVRIAGEQGFLTIKGAPVGFTRAEFEYEIPVADALELIGLCQQPVVEKTRYLVVVYGKTWEVDVFSGANEGLTLAELELDSEEEKITLPGWLGAEVSTDPRYFNSSLARMPFGSWK